MPFVVNKKFNVNISEPNAFDLYLAEIRLSDS